MRKILIGGAAAVIVLLAAALLGPSFIDWNQHKDRIQREAEAATGRKLTIAGDIGLSLLPFPQLRVRDVRFANAAGAAAPDMASLKALEVDIAFWPLLTGQVETTRVTLVEPVIELQTLADGSGNWSMKPAAPPQPAAAPGAPAPASGGDGGFPIRLGNVSVENGTVVWRDAKGGMERIERINVRASAESLQGPFRVAGDMTVRGAPATLEADIGRLAPQGTTPLRASLTLKDAKAGLVLAANLGPEAAARRIDGTVKLDAQSVAALATVFLGVPAGPARPLAVEATFLAEGDRFTVNPLSVRIDDTDFAGRVEVAPDRTGRSAVAVVLSTPRIDVDKWQALAAPGAAAAPAKPSETAPTLGGGGFFLPPTITARLDLTAETVVAQGQSMRNAKLVARLADGKVTVERAAVELPGPTAVTLSGTLAALQGQPQFDGRAQLDARSLRTLLAAYKVAPEGMPADRLGRATVQARIKAGPALVEVTELAASLDGMRATGGATLRPADRPGARLGVGARLAIDKLDLDSYLRPSAKPTVAAGAPAAAKAAAAPSNSGAVGPRIDLDIDARVGQLVAAGKTARDVVLAGVYQGGTLTLRQLSVGDYGGATAKIVGTVRDPGPAATIDLTLEASGRDLGQVLSQGGVAAPAQAFSLGGKLSGTVARLAVDLAARLGDGQARISGTVEPPRGLPGVALTVDASHPATGRLLSQLSPGYRPRGGDIGPFRLTAKTRADGGTLFLDGFSLAAGPARLEGPVRIETGGPRPRLVADLTGGELSVDAFLPVEERADLAPPPDLAPPRRSLLPGVMLAQARPAARPAPAPRSADRWSKAPLDLSALLANDADVKLRAASFQQGRWLVSRPDMAATLADGTLSLTKFAGQVYGGTVEMTGRLVAKGVPHARFDLKAQNVNVGQAIDSGGAVRLVGGRAQADIAIETTGRSIHDMVSAMAGKGELDVRDGTLRGVNLSAVAKSLQTTDLTKLPNILGLVQELGKDGDTPFSSLTATYRIEKGVIRSDDVKLAASGFTATGTTVTSLPAWTTDTRVEARIAVKPEPVPVAVRLEGSIDQPRKIFDTNALQAYLGQRVGAGGLQQLLPGLAPPAAPGQQQQQQKPRNLLEQLPSLLRR